MKRSISRRLLVQGLPALVVLCGLAALFAWRNSANEKDQIRLRISAGAAAAAETTDQYLKGRIELLQAIATRRAFQATDVGAISDELARADAPARGFAGGLTWADRSGRLRTARTPSTVEPDILQGVQASLATATPLVSDVIVAGEPVTPVILFAVPTRDDRGRINGVLAAITLVADLTALTRRLESDGDEIRLVDRSGNILFPLTGAGVTRAVDARSPYQRMRRGGAGVVDASFGLAGLPDRVIGYATAPTAGWLVVKSESRDRAFAGTTTSLRLELVTLVVAASLVGFALVLASRQEATAALNRAVLLDAERNARARAELLERTAERMAVALTEQDVAEAVVVEIEAWGIDLAGVQVVRDGSTMKILAVTGMQPDLLERLRRWPVPPGGMMADAMSKDAVVLFQTGRDHDAEYPDWAEARRSHELETIAVIPLHGPKGRVVGALLVASRQPGWLVDEWQKTLVGIARQCGIALERARLQALAELATAEAELLSQISDSLIKATSAKERGRRVVEILMHGGAAGAAVYLVDEQDQSPELIAAAGALSGAGESGDVDERVVHAIATGKAVISIRGTDAAGAAEPSGSLTVLPLRARGTTLGALAVEASAGIGGEVPSGLLVREVAVRAGFALDNALMYERERDVSHTLQMGLLGGAPLQLDGVEIDTAYWPGTVALDVGGDWYDAFPLPDGRLALVVGDVVGHSLESAVAMGHLRGAVRALAPLGGPARLIERLDDFVASLPAAQMATVAYVDLDPATGRLRYACAGHPPPLCVSADGPVRFLWEGRSAPLGLNVDGSRAEAVDLLDERETLMLYSDGLIERRGESIDVGLERLAEVAGARRAIDAPLVQHVCDTLLDGPDQDDDVCVLALRRLPARDAFAHSLRASPGELAGLRRELREWLEHGEVDPEEVQSVILAVSEAAANAVEHGYRADGVGVVTVAARLDDTATLEVVVNDRGTWREPRIDAYRGRGITIMRSLMDDVSIKSDAGATVVRMRRSTTTGGAPDAPPLVEPDRGEL